MRLKIEHALVVRSFDVFEAKLVSGFKLGSAREFFPHLVEIN